VIGDRAGAGDREGGRFCRKSGDSVWQVESGGAGGPARRGRAVGWRWSTWTILLGGWEGAPAPVGGCRCCGSCRDPSSPEIFVFTFRRSNLRETLERASGALVGDL
jgi:hypothetical protein